MATAPSHPLIRPATVEDAIVLGSLHVRTWRAAYQGIVPDTVLNCMSETQHQAHFERAISTQQEETYVLEKGSEIVGFLTLGAARDTDLAPHSTGEIWGIYISPNHWRQGLGSQLMSYAEQLLRDRAYNQIALWVLAENHAARVFYEAWGFRPDGQTKQIPWQSPAKAIRYQKPLV